MRGSKVSSGLIGSKVYELYVPLNDLFGSKADTFRYLDNAK